MSDRYLAAVNKGRGGRDPYLDAINRGTPGRSAPLGGTAPMGGSSGGSAGTRVLQALKRLARLSPYLVPAVAVAGMSVADEVGMAQAASVWKFGMGSRLDDGVKNLMPQILATSKSGWIADDQEEFARVQAIFHREVGALRNAFGEIGGVIDEIAAGFRTYWLQLGSAVATAGTLLVTALRMKLSMVPAVSAAGRIMEHLVGSTMLSTVTIFTGMLGSMLKNGMDVLGNLIKKSHQFGFVLPVGAAAIDFTQATMDTRDLVTYTEPPAPGQLPAGYQDFEWVAPDVQTTR
ncbi:hypothetical protein [Nonomuraea sp. B5E05]|uniref:hypothetical protein n=1 Tax=Nonomuraea sp. B5E05 TaxID=3153569 RepID=UPI00326123EE